MPAIVAAAWVLAAALPHRTPSRPFDVEATGLAEDHAVLVAPRAPQLDPAAAAAVRSGDFETADKLLRPRTDSTAVDAAQRQVILGLYANALGENQAALELLSISHDPTGTLEDWRWWTLAQSAVSLGATAAAREALDSLLALPGRSPLHAAALVESARLALDQGDLASARKWVLAGWARDLGPILTDELNALALAVGEALDDVDFHRRAAIELLAEASQLVDELGVLDTLTDGADPEWDALLSVEQIHRRAASLLRQEKVPEALLILEALPAEERDLAWSLQMARALTAARRGVEALAALGGVVAHVDSDRAALAWERAQAARDAGKARRGRANLPSNEREAMRHRAIEELWSAVALSTDNDLRTGALRQIYDLLGLEDRFDQAVQVLRQLLELSSDDRTGARDLWQLGWNEYRSRNHSGAIGYWAELFDLYPDSSHARGGRYWSAACFKALGDTAHAASIYRQLATADATDFYSRYAQIRLGRSPGASPAVPSRPKARWPTDPLLNRARLLTDLGLDRAALMELGMLQERADSRSWDALEGLTLSRTGQHRLAIPHLLRAFPALGGPRQAGVPDEALRHYYPLAFVPEVIQNSRRAALPVPLVLAMIRQESAFDPQARSRAGARGLMQLMPATAREWAQRLGLPYSTARLHDPDYSIRLGTAYFANVLNLFDGTTELALAGYNGGPTRIRRLWGRAGSQGDLDLFVESLSLEESKGYVKRVLLLADSYRQLYPELTINS